MALGGVVSFLACSLLFLLPIAATEVALPPILAPIWNGTCDSIYCGKGTCKANPNSTFLFSCECDAGWKQSSIEDYSFKFMPCVIPNWMGCAQSKIENKEAVSRCKDWKIHMKEAVASRNLFAATHSAYTMALKHTGAALSDYSTDEVQEYHGFASPTALQNPRDTLSPPPPPPFPDLSPTPLARSSSMPEISGPKSDPKPAETIQEEEDVEEEDDAAEPAEPEPEPTTSTSPPPPPLLSRPQPNPVAPPHAPPESRNETWDYFCKCKKSHSLKDGVPSLRSFS